MALITLNPLMTVWELAAMLVLTGSYSLKQEAHA